MHTLPYEIDCPHCGCADVEVRRAPEGEQWFAAGQAECNACGRDFTFREPEQAADSDEPEPYPGVPYIPARCPRCQADDVPVQHTSGRTRYHTCRRCGLNFKSLEKRL